MQAANSSTKPKLFALAWPIFVEQGLRVLIGTVDTIMVSHLGDDAVAGVGVATQVFTLFIIVFAFIGIGSSVVITHHLGAKDRSGADQITTTAIAANTWIGVAASLLVLFGAEAMLRFMELDGAPLAYGKPFLALMGGTLFLEAMNGAISASLRAHSHTRDAMWVTAGQNVLNVIGNCLLLFGLCGFPKLGVVGVAISGIVSRVAASIALWFILEWRTRLRMRVRDYFAIRWDKLGSILHIGLPAAGEHTSWWLAFMMITRFCAEMGGPALATQQYAALLAARPEAGLGYGRHLVRDGVRRMDARPAHVLALAEMEVVALRPSQPCRRAGKGARRGSEHRDRRDLSVDDRKDGLCRVTPAFAGWRSASGPRGRSQ